MAEEIIGQLLASGESVGGYLLVWILYEQHKRLKRLEDTVYETRPQ
jgi:hypothetical protein